MVGIFDRTLDEMCDAGKAFIIVSSRGLGRLVLLLHYLTDPVVPLSLAKISSVTRTFFHLPYLPT